MLKKVLNALLREYRTRRMGQFAAWLLAYGIALELVDRFSTGVPGVLWGIFWVCAIPTGLYYLGRGVGYIRASLLWRLRRRLVVAYIFIAVVPIVLIVFLVATAVVVINGQFAAFLVTLKLRGYVGELQEMARVVGHQTHRAPEKSPGKLLDRLREFFVQELGAHAASYPGLEVTLRVGSEATAFRLDGTKLDHPLDVPRWFEGEEFADIVMDNRQLALRAIDRSPTPVGDLLVILSEPVTPELLDLMGRGIGPVGVQLTREQTAAEQSRGGGPQPSVRTQEGQYVYDVSINSRSVQIPPPFARFDVAVFGASTFDPVVWTAEHAERLRDPVFVFVTSRIVALNRQLLATLGRFSQLYVVVFLALAAVFLIIELFSLILGLRLTRTITRTVDELYDATERVKAGDFSYRINMRPADQLTALGAAFDGMTASVERLLRESEERLKLESELEIARQVQRQLFPQTAPEVPGLRLYGVCKAARSVSGDYYDFLKLDEHRVGLVLGDVSGKGISAALLMAAIQSALRAQFYNGFIPAGAAAPPGEISTGQIVARLNHQLCENTPAEKYVTFFYGEYDSRTRRLTYTNAGHLPPILFSGNRIERLRAGGTVVGLFHDMVYEQGELQMQPGDLLLAFTDGITEPENIYGEEFGEERVLEVARKALNDPPETLAEEIYRSVSDWTGSPELQDDMTLLVAKALP